MTSGEPTGEPLGGCGHVPEYCVWELTLRCNLRCLHCGSAAGKARDGELTVDECLPIADELAELGCRQATLIGGEIFLFRGWERVAGRLTERGVATNIITNGMALGDRQLAEIRAAGLDSVCVSVDGMRASHDAIRNLEGSYERAIASLKRLREEGVPTSVVTTLMARNVDDLPELHAVLVSLGVEVWQLQLATPMGNLAGAHGMLLDPARVPEVTRFIREHRDASRMWILAGDDIGYYDEHEPYLRNLPGMICSWQGCSAGLRAVGIDSVGNVKGCESLYDARFIEGNLRSQRLTELWNREGAFSYNRRFNVAQLSGSCKGCDMGPRCRGGCRGSCFFSSDELFENPYCCYPGRPGQSAAPVTCPPRRAPPPRPGAGRRKPVPAGRRWR
jgi:radical SAM protein with 4Fe4S-binding SPASM domain